ncbi:histidine--tRNA ligase [Candidatus Daviesbacteria bacterium RIFCSPHIGHO2_01_FULL_36_37]|uniref:Histidine--tRNA ligase n=3 Tax=Candidatus Daviesiibacteriota TaxID=1752718 RepID=A0A0G0EL47_9BACT|nr:MAG: Histidyl-tRNA synthetase [Candidatus Daviesbacteria bacterium GW2011_GWB1_36_5]OGE17129.1 MAG: histidine--tRNA ligase [Candidatus Daviesbacteria bacterium RIFCSPHIGHO2_01_FULL_36_37]OGE32744.1 MAG: histidine--tRNA ligase [Candidatus Daviesbacteria bacterium RIFCSPHIGHO2_02_FULL_37_9]OGE35910.1 MAG: histidine--tRNA ligase [Candidatus Daviesbacteria bacterium RIFCSPHIGHO2_12_FULL_37_16]
MNIKASTPKGFRDYLPADAIARQVVLEKIQKVFQKFGFDPLETPTLEFEETLTGKYGEEEKLIYKFETPGGDKVALKYDQTVPLARVIAQYGPRGAQTLPIPFKRYQIQDAYRGENPQKGRYRQFLQCDGDIIGISSPLADAEILALTYEIYSELGLDVVIKINDRALIADVEPKFLAAIDKLGKIGEVGVLEELQQKGLSSNEASELLSKVKILKPTQKLDQIITFYKGMGYPEGSLQFDPALIRGLDYYTGLILEVVLKSDPNSSSLAGGGRWDSLIGKFTGMDLAAIGFAIGVDRTIEAMESLGVLDAGKTSSKVLVTIFSEQLQNKSLEISSRLRSNKIPTELWLDPEAKLEKQLKYADQKGIPYALIIGPDEAEKDMVNLKNLTTKTQETLTLDEVIQKLTS